MSDWKSIHLDDPSMWPTEVIVPLEASHNDERGSIQPLYDLPTKSVVIISSKKGTVRANHYHLTDWHYCYVVSGQIEYLHRQTGSNQKPKTILVNEGEMIFTPPMVDHGMTFPVDTVFLTLSRNPRDQQSYESDVVRVEMISSDGLKSWTPHTGDK